jgi:hypothetical protein
LREVRPTDLGGPQMAIPSSRMTPSIATSSRLSKNFSPCEREVHRGGRTVTGSHIQGVTQSRGHTGNCFMPLDEQ